MRLFASGKLALANCRVKTDRCKDDTVSHMFSISGSGSGSRVWVYLEFFLAAVAPRLFWRDL